MSALVDYGSSDEEDTTNGLQSETSKPVEAPSTIPQQSHTTTTNGTSTTSDATPTSPSQSTLSQPLPSTDEPTQGPSLGPTAPLTISSAISFPYTAQRSAIQHLTLPTHPKLAIPPSPPTSPPPGLDPKISHFHSLKRQGIHFNAKLASSSVLKNPSLLPKLMESAGLEGEGGRDQYATTLPRDVWDPDGFPEEVYKEGLADMQQEVGKRTEKERKGAVREYVPGKAEKVEVGVGMNVGDRQSAAERVMAGLERRGGREGERDAKRRKG